MKLETISYLGSRSAGLTAPNSGRERPSGRNRYPINDQTLAVDGGDDLCLCRIPGAAAGVAMVPDLDRVSVIVLVLAFVLRVLVKAGEASIQLSSLLRQLSSCQAMVGPVPACD